ncbi:MAG: hypothetical protein WAR37_04550 [Candidatus Microsaccharimonas sp.]
MFKKHAKPTSDDVPRRRRIDYDQDGFSSSTPANQQYKRNQTLSSYRHNTPEESTRQKAHTLTQQRRRLGGLFAIVASVSLLLTLLLWQLMAQVHVTTTTKQISQSFSADIYEATINQYLGINPAQRLRFALNQTTLSEYVSGELPEVEKVAVTGFAGLAQSNFSITFRTPIAGWQINGKQYYVDVNGVVFEKNYYAAPAVQVVDESGVSPEQGSAVVGTRLLGFLGRVVAEAQGRGYTVNRAVLPADTTRQLDVFIEGIPTRVKFVIDRGAGEQVEDMDRSLKYLASRGINAEYVDVRVSGRAAYK